MYSGHLYTSLTEDMYLKQFEKAFQLTRFDTIESSATYIELCTSVLTIHTYDISYETSN